MPDERRGILGRVIGPQPRTACGRSGVRPVTRPDPRLG